MIVLTCTEVAETKETCMSDEYMTTDEVARILRVSTKTIRNMCEDGRLKAIRAGRQWRIDREAFEEYRRTGGHTEHDKGKGSAPSCAASYSTHTTAAAYTTA